MNPQETEIPNPIIDKIIAQDKKAFEQWSSNPDNQRRLDMPKEVLRYFIPKKILELAEDPEKVDVVLIDTEKNPDSLTALIIERKHNSISDPDSFDAYNRDVRELEIQRANQRAASGKRISVPSGRTNIPMPPDVDNFHATHLNMVSQGFIRLNDYVFLNITLSNKVSPKLLNVENYQDREENRGKKVAPSFYDRLREISKSLGFRFIVGWNLADKAREFFIKMGRSSLAQIKPEFRGEFHPHQDDPFLTVDFLYKEDTERYLIKPLA